MSNLDKEKPSSDLVEHTGSCHCGRVRFKVRAPAHDLPVYDCNCSVCTKKQNRHFIVPATMFELVGDSASHLTTYRFNTQQAEHTFCQNCGVQSFYRPRSNPDGYGVMPHCIDSPTIVSVKHMTFNGREWESAYANDSFIKNLSK